MMTRPSVSLRSPDPTRPGTESVETHVSTVVFDGDLVHKRKKPVRFPFIDLSTRELRAEMCHREVALNRRFGPDVYLGVEDIVDDAGQVVDHAVLMRRMPADRGSRSGASASRHHRVPRAVARTMAVCHVVRRGPRRSRRSRHRGTARTVVREPSRAVDLLPSPIDAATLERIGELAQRYLDGTRSLLAERIAAGRIVDGHGDLLAEDIFCLDDGPRILDCLEFDDRLRWGDVLYDVGFLAMDVERLGRPDLALAFFEWYREHSAETHPPSLEHHYVAYRALVRSKVSCLRGNPHDLVDAHAYLAQCQRHLYDGRVQLVVIGGLPGTGKSTLATALGDELGWPVLRTDELRKDLAGLDPLDHAPAAYGQGLYSPAMTEATYDTLVSRAGLLLARGSSVILDASFATSRWRTRVAAPATESSSDLVELRCLLPADVAATRLIARGAIGDDPSDADGAVAAAMASNFDDWPSAATVGTSPPIEDILPAVLDRIDAPTGRSAA